MGLLNGPLQAYRSVIYLAYGASAFVAEFRHAWQVAGFAPTRGIPLPASKIPALQRKGRPINGLTPQQHQLLLGVAGFTGRGWATITELAEFLQERHNAVV